VRIRPIDPAWTPLQRPDARHQLAEVEGLDEVVVGAGIEALDAIGRRVARGQHQERRRA
jgi:hypothetical protein